MGLKDKLKEFGEGTPGSRFQERYEQHHQNGRKGLAKRVLVMGAGICIMLAGVVFLAIPGPGLLIIALGAAFIARESLAMAKLLDRTEVWIREFIEKVKSRFSSHGSRHRSHGQRNR